MKSTFIYLLVLSISILLFASCSQGDAQKSKEPLELMEVTGVVTGYKNDVMLVKVLRTQMEHPLRMTGETKMDIFAAPKDTVLLVYTGYLGYPVQMPVIREVHTRPFKDVNSKIINLKELREENPELITR